MYAVSLGWCVCVRVCDRGQCLWLTFSCHSAMNVSYNALSGTIPTDLADKFMWIGYDLPPGPPAFIAALIPTLDCLLSAAIRSHVSYRVGVMTSHAARSCACVHAAPWTCDTTISVAARLCLSKAWILYTWTTIASGTVHTFDSLGASLPQNPIKRQP